MSIQQTLRVASVLAVLGIAVVARAVPTVFSGSDSGANSTDPRPNSNAAAAAFDAAAGALGSVSVITFESAPLGAFTNLSVATGVTLDGSNISSGQQTIVNSPLGTPTDCSGTTQLGVGSQWASFGGTMTFTFTTPVQAFGAYFSGIQLAGETITYTDGSTEVIPIPTVSSGVAFVGFTDSGRQIASITINALNDIIGMDDVRFVTSGNRVPDGSTTLTLLGLAFLGLVAIRRKISG